MESWKLIHIPLLKAWHWPANHFILIAGQNIVASLSSLWGLLPMCTSISVQKYNLHDNNKASHNWTKRFLSHMNTTLIKWQSINFASSKGSAVILCRGDRGKLSHFRNRCIFQHWLSWKIYLSKNKHTKQSYDVLCWTGQLSAIQNSSPVQ